LATVSRRVAELEEHLNVRLLHRGHRKVVLTDAGRSYVDSCRRIMEEIAEVERTASGEYRAPQGELIITTPAVLGPHALAAAPRRLKPIKSPATHPANHQRPEAAVFESRLPA
jgi:DNA-binding transcriptional LysR family regulator